MKKMLSLLLAAAAALSLSAGAYADAAAPASSSNAQDDVAKMYRVKHELKFDLAGKSAKLDGTSIAADKPILKSGRVYVPLRTLRQSGAAGSVTWDAAKRQVHVVMNQEVMPQLNNLTFRIGSENIYMKDGTAISEKIPAPFISGGVTYVPVRALTWLGMSVSTEKGMVSWNWSDKIIEILKPEWETGEASTTFTMLYQKDMYIPQYLYPLGSGAWGGESGKVTDKDISLDGRMYNRMQFTVKLRPGPNPIMLTAVSAGSKVITVKQTVSDPSSIPVTILEMEGEGNISFMKPFNGYMQVEPGEKIEVAGDILQKNDLFDKLTVNVERYAPSSEDSYQVYEDVKHFELPIKDQKFSGSFSLSDKGSYVIKVISPAYIPYPEHGPAKTEWAEFVVEVK